jgi:DNA-binding NarL/FixJ family response regulator
MDIEMPQLNGIEATKQMLWQNNNVYFIAITMYEEKAYLTELIRSGFKACVFKNNVYEELDKAIYKVCNGEFYYPDEIKLQDENINNISHKV